MEQLKANRKDLEVALLNNREHLFTGAFPEMLELSDDRKDGYLKQLASEIIAMPNFTKSVGKFFESDPGSKGQVTLWRAINTACQFGFHIGTHCYLIPGWQDAGSCICEPTVNGYAKLLVGPGKVFKTVKQSVVRENDLECSIDECAGTFVNNILMKGERGKLCGVIVQGIFNDGVFDVKYYNREWLDKRKEKSSGFVDKTWPHEMDIKRAMKGYIKPYVMRYGSPEAIDAFFSEDLKQESNDYYNDPDAEPETDKAPADSPAEETQDMTPNKAKF